MKTYILNLGGQHSQICVDAMMQVDDFVSFYNAKELVALVRMSPGDSIVDKSATPGERKCPDCGHAPYERGTDATAEGDDEMRTYVTNK